MSVDRRTVLGGFVPAVLGGFAATQVPPVFLRDDEETVIDAVDVQFADGHTAEELRTDDDPALGAALVGAALVSGIPRHVAERLGITTLDFGATPMTPASTVVGCSAELQAQIDWVYAERQSKTTLHEEVEGHGYFVLDLGGREYYLDEPVLLPSQGGGVQIRNGYITASDEFPEGAYLLSNVHAENLTTDQLDFSHIVFNGRNRANLLRLKRFIRVGIDRCVFTGNYEFGLFLDSLGFELMCSRSYFPQSYVGPTKPGTVGIHIDNGVTDNHFTDCVTLNNEIGVDSYAAANIYTNFHFYGADYRKTDPDLANAYGLKLNGNTTNNRVQQCQFDTGVRLYIENPARTLVNRNTFATLSGPAANAIVLKAVTNGHIPVGVDISQNMFDLVSGSDAIVIDPTSLGWGSINGLNVYNNTGQSGVKIRGTRFNAQSTCVANSTGTFDLNGKYLIGALRHNQLTGRNTTGAGATVFAANLTAITIPSTVPPQWAISPTVARLITFVGTATAKWTASDTFTGVMYGQFGFVNDDAV